jgi:hypothetical protein
MAVSNLCLRFVIAVQLNLRAVGKLTDVATAKFASAAGIESDSKIELPTVQPPY